MTIKKLPIKPQVQESRKGNIDVFFKSKNRYPQECFLEIEFLIKSPNGQKYFERGYSQSFIPTNRVELIEAKNSAQLNAIAKVLYRDGFSFTESEDVVSFEKEFDVGDIEVLDYLFYYTKYKGENITTREDGQGFETVTFKTNFGEPQEYTQDVQKEEREIKTIIENEPKP